MPSTTLPVRTATADYTVEIGSGLLPHVGARLDALLSGGISSARQRAIVLTSPEIWRLWGPLLQSGFSAPLHVLEIPPGEQHKRLSTVERLLEQLAAAAADRDTVLLALGGGVIGDITGYVAASYMRGIRYVQLPTTALAQIDSSVGGKTGVNLAAGKNLVGAFYHPLAVFADLDTLSTLPPAELRAGLQEAVKAGIIRDPALFAFMEAHAPAVLSLHPPAILRVIADSVRIKAEVVGLDERENGLRMILNLGHTLGHAIEAATGYTALLHGEAVAWGMIASTRIALHRGTLKPDELQRIEALIRAYGPLPRFTADPDRLVALTARDKKNRSGIRSYVVPVGIGLAAVLPDVSADELLLAARDLIALVEATP